MFESVTNHHRYLISRSVMIAFIENMHLFTLLENLHDIMVKSYFTICKG